MRMENERNSQGDERYANAQNDWDPSGGICKIWLDTWGGFWPAGSVLSEAGEILSMSFGFILPVDIIYDG